jgi:DNA-binding HxlR family transcriptional regulator
MAKRSYRQNCALAQASDVIGERWSLLLVRDLPCLQQDSRNSKPPASSGGEQAMQVVISMP